MNEILNMCLKTDEQPAQSQKQKEFVKELKMKANEVKDLIINQVINEGSSE